MLLKEKGSIAIIVAAFIMGLLPVTIAFGQVSCADVTYGNPNYNDKMDELAERAKLPDSYWNRYHALVVSSLCGGKIEDIDGLIDSGYVKTGEVQNIARVLGKTYKPKKRSESGMKYGDAREKFAKMGACSSCADNIAQYYTTKPGSLCGKLAKQALGGNPEATRKLVEFPDYCTWKY